MSEFWWVLIFTICWAIIVAAQLWNKEAVGYGVFSKEDYPIIYKVLISIHIMLFLALLFWFLRIVNIL